MIGIYNTSRGAGGGGSSGASSGGYETEDVRTRACFCVCLCLGSVYRLSLLSPLNRARADGERDEAAAGHEVAAAAARQLASITQEQRRRIEEVRNLRESSAGIPNIDARRSYSCRQFICCRLWGRDCLRLGIRAYLEKGTALDYIRSLLVPKVRYCSTVPIFKSSPGSRVQVRGERKPSEP